MARCSLSLGLIFGTSLFAPLLAHAYSGAAGAECGNTKLEITALKGTPSALEAAIDDSVTTLESVVSRWSSGIAKLYPDTSRVWLDPDVKTSSREAKRKTFVRWWTGCQGIKILDAAVAGANVENVKRLLLLGADPNNPSVSWGGGALLMRCPVARDNSVSVNSTPPARTPEEVEAVVGVYAVLLRAGADPQQQDREGLTPLHLCKDPVVVNLFIKAGADVSIGIQPGADLATLYDYPITKRILDHRVRQIAKLGPTWEREAQFAIIEMIAPLLKDTRVTKETERLVSWGCKDPRNAETCIRLGALITVTDKEILKPLGQRATRKVPAADANRLTPSSSGQPTAAVHIEQRFDLQPDPKPNESSAQKLTCAFPDLKLPEKFAVFAAGAYSGRKISYQIDQSGHGGTQVDVAVNSSEKPIVLLLGAYEPTIWNVGWSEKTNILAVLVSGYHRQVIAGLEKTTPVLVSTYDNRGPCGYFYVTPNNLSPLNPVSKRIFGRPVDMVFPAQNGKVVVGDPVSVETKLVTSRDVTPESFRDKSAPIAGPAGLADAVNKGLLRKATAADAEAWSDAVLENSPQRDIPPVAGQGIPRPPKPPIYNAYVVLKAFAYPLGLYGGNSATFLIPKGVPKPEGHPGHSSVYDFNILNCHGPLCNAR